MRCATDVMEAGSEDHEERLERTDGDREMTTRPSAAAIYAIEVSEVRTNRLCALVRAIWSTTVMASNEPARRCLVKVKRIDDGSVAISYSYGLKSDALLHAQTLSERLKATSASEFEAIWQPGRNGNDQKSR